MRRLSEERGSGTVLSVAVIAGILAIVGMVIPVSLALAVKQRVVGAADAAALAAADTASGFASGFPCDAAAKAARLNGAELSRCDLDGLVATVTARTGYLGMEVSVAARAGPPGTRAGPPGTRAGPPGS
jgi:secretion/DNA translocation related TadE-like protein